METSSLRRLVLIGCSRYWGWQAWPERASALNVYTYKYDVHMWLVYRLTRSRKRSTEICGAQRDHSSVWFGWHSGPAGKRTHFLCTRSTPSLRSHYYKAAAESKTEIHETRIFLEYFPQEFSSHSGFGRANAFFLVQSLAFYLFFFTFACRYGWIARTIFCTRAWKPRSGSYDVFEARTRRSPRHRFCSIELCGPVKTRLLQRRNLTRLAGTQCFSRKRAFMRRRS